jgi:predicted nucleic acid-binding protein
VVVNDHVLLLAAMTASARWQLSLWDALVIEAARSAGAKRVWTEDLNSGQDFGGVQAVNPFQFSTI